MQRVYKNFFNLELDFNKLTKMFCNDAYESILRGRYLNNYILNSIFVVKNVHNNPLFFDLIKLCVEKFKYNNRKLDAFLFIGVTPGACSDPHRDDYDVLLFNLYGETMYVVENEKFVINNKDLIMIKKNETHQAFSLTPRITFSLGIRDN